MCSEADLGVIALDKNKNYKGIIETRGLTNITGGIFDMYRFGLTFFVPQFYPVKEPNEGILRYQNGDDFMTQLQLLISNKAEVNRHNRKNLMKEIYTFNADSVRLLLKL